MLEPQNAFYLTARLFCKKSSRESQQKPVSNQVGVNHSFVWLGTPAVRKGNTVKTQEGGYSYMFRIGVLRLGYETSAKKIISSIEIDPKNNFSCLAHPKK